MTLNIWGLSGNWERRCQQIVKLLKHEQPDIVGLQEVCHLRGSGLIGESQAVVLARMAGYHFWHFVPAHRSETKTVGQAILSHHPITAVDILPFHCDPTDPKDTEDRVAVWVRVALGRGVEFCVTHLSLSRKARERSVQQLASWLWRISSAPKILVGDLNDEPNSPPLQFLLSEASPPFADAWQIVNGAEGGFTFPSHSPKHRIDYVLFSPPDTFEVEEIRTVGDVPDSYGIYPSDHLGLVAVLKSSEGRATALPKTIKFFGKPGGLPSENENSGFLEILFATANCESRARFYTVPTIPLCTKFPCHWVKVGGV